MMIPHLCSMSIHCPSLQVNWPYFNIFIKVPLIIIFLKGEVFCLFFSCMWKGESENGFSFALGSQPPWGDRRSTLSKIYFIHHLSLRKGYSQRKVKAKVLTQIFTLQNLHRFVLYLSSSSSLLLSQSLSPQSSLSSSPSSSYSTSSPSASQSSSPTCRACGQFDGFDPRRPDDRVAFVVAHSREVDFVHTWSYICYICYICRRASCKKLKALSATRKLARKYNKIGDDFKNLSQGNAAFL